MASTDKWETQAPESPAYPRNSPAGGDAASDDQLSEDEGSMISQANFATQLPFTQAVVQAKQVLPTAQKVNHGSTLDLLRRKPREALHRRTPPASPVTIEGDEENPTRHRNPTLKTEETEANTAVASSLLSQRPLQDTRASSPSSSMPLPTNISLHNPAHPISPDDNAAHPRILAHDDKSTSATPSNQPMPISMQNRFRQWRAEAMANRHLPRRLSAIPNSQSALVDSNDNFHPPLAGRDLRPGSLPLVLLNNLTAKADKLAAMALASAEAKAPHTEDSPSVQNADAKQRAGTDLPSLLSSQQVPSEAWPESPEPPLRAPILPLDSSQPVPSDAWPESPEPLTRAAGLPPDSSQQAPSESAAESPKPVARAASLPPDSSPLRPSMKQARDESETSSVGDDVLVVPQNPQASVIQANPHLAPQASSISSPMDSAHAQPAATASDVVEPQDNDGAQSHLPDLVGTAPDTRQDAQNIVQVKRTPYPGKTIHSTGSAVATNASPEGLTGSGNDRILSTYDEISLQQHLSTKSLSKARILPPASAKQSAPLQQTQTSASAKRRASNNAEGVSEAKRPRFVSKGRYLDSIDADYLHVMEANRARRSAELSVLVTKKKEMHEPPKPIAATSPSLRKVQTNSSITSAGPSRRQSRSDAAAALSTPITMPSNDDLPDGEDDNSARYIVETTSMTPVPDSLFQLYQTAYQDYKGNVKCFSNAYALLLRLCDAGREPHPSLFDDFIFHHYHSYRQYLKQIAESSDDPVPYLEFYNGFITDPSHKARIISAEVLSRRASRLATLRRESSNFAPKSDGLAHGSDKSVDMISSASHHLPAQRQLFPQPELETLRDAPVSKNIGKPNEASLMDPSQRSSVKSWIEGVRGASPELGTPDVDRSQEITFEGENDPSPVDMPPTPKLQKTAKSPSIPNPTVAAGAPATFRQRKSQLSASPFVSGSQKPKPLKEPDSKWWKHENTPFKLFAEQYSQLHSVKRENAASLINPQRLDIYAWR